MKFVEELVAHLLHAGLLSASRLEALEQRGFWSSRREEEHDEADWYQGEAEDSRLFEAQEELSGARARRGRPAGRAGRSRRQWWRGYKVTQLIGARLRAGGP